MDESAIVGFLEYLGRDEAAQRLLASCTTLAELADALALGGGSSEDWLPLLERAEAARSHPPGWHSLTAPPRQWLPVQLYHDQGEMRVEWLHFAFAPLSDPFFEQTLAKIAGLPMNALLRCSTPLDALLAFEGETQPDGLVFHVSRCGSTLVGQMLGAVGDVTVLAEPPVLDHALALYLTGAIPAPIVRGIAGALGRERIGPSRHRVIKLDAWHSLALARIAGVFPRARTAFLFRDPIEVLVSQQGRPGLHVRRGAVPLAAFGLGGDDRIADEDFAAWVIGAVYRAGLNAAGRPGLAYFDYAGFPDTIETALFPHLGIAPGADARARLAEAGGRYSKDPSRSFAPDAASKQAEADDAVRARAEAHGLPDSYQALRSLAQGGAGQAARASTWSLPQPGAQARVSITFD